MKSFESHLRIFTGVCLWTVSATMGVSLYLAFTGDTWYAWLIAGLLGLGLESAKILSWRRGGCSRFLAVALSGLTILSVLGTSLSAIEHRKAGSHQAQFRGLQATRAYQDLLGQVHGLEAQEKALLSRLEGLPPDFVSASSKFINTLESLRRERAGLSTQLGELEQKVSHEGGGEAPPLFSSLAKLFGQDQELVELSILLALAVLIEVSAFSLVGQGNNLGNIKKTGEEETVGTEIGTVGTPKPPSVPTFGTDDLTPGIASSPVDDYLRVALDHESSPRLLGRNIVAKRLGVTDRVARKLLAQLDAVGKIRRESRFWVAVST